ncbi:replication protein A 70 kDa DNA-binding subunit [Cephus cinctus]|uniref:Replication protein A subunit n=1 Tax=Cephus cinctus TaxID=211228 RepID=A0AAJ7CBQ6_CEPCN|nr:replication protein A 70 kDa DNA-binding subunit [Cephus cinctus]
MGSLTEGAIDNIMNGIDVEKPVLQILGNKKLSTSSTGERYRLLVSDGVRINSFTMLATQLNHLVTENILSEYSICRIDRYAISMVNNGGKQKRVMVILSIDVIKPGSEVGRKIGNPMTQDGNPESESASSNVKAVSPPKAKTIKPYVPSHNISTTDISTTPIAGLSPYQNRWVIKVRVTSKPPIRTWSNSRGEGKLFSMDLLDESGEIRCTGFKEQCDKFYDMIEVGKIYYISRCALKPANKKFSSLNNDYEMTLTNDSEIIPCDDASTDIPTIQYNFCPISEVESKAKDELIDVIGVCKSYNDVQTLVSRATQKELKKRDVELVDESNLSVTLTLWGTQAIDFDGSNNPVLAIKGVRIGEFNGGKNLSLLGSSNMTIEPDLPEAHKLRGWYNTTGKMQETKSLSKVLGGGGSNSFNGPILCFKEAVDLGLGRNDSADYYVVKATVNMVRAENSLYKACPTEDCKKKVVDQSNDMYRCEKCDRDYPNFKYRLLASANLVDWSGNVWATAFSEEGEKLLGVTAQELGELKENDSDAFLEKFAQISFNSFMFKLRVKMEVFSDEARLKTTITAVSPLDFKEYNKFLISKIKELANIGKSE